MKLTKYRGPLFWTDIVEGQLEVFSKLLTELVHEQFTVPETKITASYLFLRFSFKGILTFRR